MFAVRTSARLERKREDDLLEIFVCEYCNMEFRSPTALLRHSTVCLKNSANQLPPRPFKIPPRPTTQVEQIHVDLMPRSRKVDLVERLGLLPLSKAKVVRKQRSRVKDIKITKLDHDSSDKDSALLKSPTTPRTAKSLMSQLSREFSPTIKTRRKSLFGACETVENSEPVRIAEASDAESTSSKSSKEVADSDAYKDPWNKEKRTSILSIDFSSPLGTRVADLMNQQAEKVRVHSEEPTANYEEFCHTPKKTDMIRRLRDRKDMITFKKNRRSCPKWAHAYKFTKAERVEWYRTIRTGLNARSRPLLKLIKECNVKITRVSQDTIKKWSVRKPRPAMSLLDAQTLQNMLRQQGIFVPNGASPELQRMLLSGQAGQLGYGPASQQKRLVMNSVLNEMRAAGGKFSPSLLRNYPMPSGIYANSNARNPQMPQNIARNVAQNVVRNLTNQMNYKFMKGSKTDMNHNKQAVKRPKTSTKNPIVIDDEDEDVVAMPGSVPPQKRRKVEQPAAPSLLFKCHLCGEELTCSGSFARYVEQHFADRHNVHTIQLIEHIDQNGQKVVSIVEKQRQQQKAGSMQNDNRASNSNKGPSHTQMSNASQGGTPGHKKQMPQLQRASNAGPRNSKGISPKVQNNAKAVAPLSSSSNKPHVAQRKSGGPSQKNRNSSPAAVICID